MFVSGEGVAKADAEASRLYALKRLEVRTIIFEEDNKKCVAQNRAEAI